MCNIRNLIFPNLPVLFRWWKVKAPKISWVFVLKTSNKGDAILEDCLQRLAYKARPKELRWEKQEMATVKRKESWQNPRRDNDKSGSWGLVSKALQQKMLAILFQFTLSVQKVIPLIFLSLDLLIWTHYTCT